MKVNLNVSADRRVPACQCSARFLATWTAADQRAEQGSCTLLNINAGENKCDPLLSSLDLSLSVSLPGILLPALPAASTLKHPRAVAAEQEESRSKIPGPPSSLCFPSSSHFLSSVFCQTRSCNRQKGMKVLETCQHADLKKGCEWATGSTPQIGIYYWVWQINKTIPPHRCVYWHICVFCPLAIPFLFLDHHFCDEILRPLFLIY